MTPARPEKKPRLTYQARLGLLCLLAALPSFALAMYFLWQTDWDNGARWTLAVICAGFAIGCAVAVRERFIRPAQTLANLLEALREEDYSLRARRLLPDDALDEVMREVNVLGDVLRTKRLGSMEASALLRAVIAEIDVAIFAFDQESRLKLVNPAGARLLGEPEERLLARSADDLALAPFLDAEAFVAQHQFPGGAGRWGVRTRTFREEGAPRRLLVITDLTRALREEELEAWKRLVRVLGHELNNSLAPIHSIAESLQSLLSRETLPPDWRGDTLRGLGVIGNRAESLGRFLEAYSRLARLPAPSKAPVSVPAWIHRVAALEARAPLRIAEGPPIEIQADPGQLDQMLINLLRNAAEASAETGGTVELGWRNGRGSLEVWVRDQGLGIANPANLFVPFFTTKPGGSGIGLVLSRQIAEAHGGKLTLENREDAAGCEALLQLPLS